MTTPHSLRARLRAALFTVAFAALAALLVAGLPPSKADIAVAIPAAAITAPHQNGSARVVFDRGVVATRTASGAAAQTAAADAEAAPAPVAPAAPAARAAAPAPAPPPAPAAVERAIGRFVVTCYALQGTTASGHPVSSDVVAVDPDVIPLGSRIHVEGVGWRVARDTGPKVQGNRLDIWHPSSAWCRQFGARELAVTLA